MEAQEILETVSKHLFNQGTQSANIHSQCLYRGDNGTSCAVGCLIPDEDYNPEMEGVDDIQLYKDFADDVPSVAALGKHINLLDNLQCVHDTAGNWTSSNCMRKALATAGRANNLDVAFLQSLSFKDR